MYDTIALHNHASKTIYPAMSITSLWNKPANNPSLSLEDLLVKIWHYNWKKVSPG